MVKLLESHSALSRLKASSSFGLRISSKHNVSAYILSTKIKRILNTEFTPERFEQYLKQHGYVTGTSVDRTDKINQLITRLDKIPTAGVEHLYAKYESNGFWALVNTLSWPMAKLMRAGTFKKQDEVQELVRLVKKQANG